MRSKQTKDLFKSSVIGLVRNYPKLLGREYKDCIQSIMSFLTSIYMIWKNVMQFLGVLALPFLFPLVLVFMYYKCWRSTMNDFNKNQTQGYNDKYRDKHS
ncbi:MAG: hypothetical protein [Bacteriophage sp.]|nr:MAG: hypothetical protein [Bacteriophage sp.]